MACLGKFDDLDFVLEARLTAKSAMSTPLTPQNSFRQHLPYLCYCCEQSNHCLLLNEAQHPQVSYLLGSNAIDFNVFWLPQSHLLLNIKHHQHHHTESHTKKESKRYIKLHNQ